MFLRKTGGDNAAMIWLFFGVRSSPRGTVLRWFSSVASPATAGAKDVRRDSYGPHL